MNPSQMVADNLSNIHTNHITMMPTPGLKKEQREVVEAESKQLFEDVRSGNLDFITDILAAHAIILDNIFYVCHKKASKGNHFTELNTLALKASDQLRKTGLALAQIKNVILNIENLSFQQNNLIQVGIDRKNCDAGEKYGETLVTAEP